MSKIVPTCKEEKAYFDYVSEHINNVQTSFAVLGKALTEVLDYNYAMVAERVKVHDQSKYSDMEFNGYRQYYNPKHGKKPREDLLTASWVHHYQNNDHHPEYWMRINGGITMDIDPMTNDALAEMFCDWAAMGIKFNSRPDIWYTKTGYKELPFNEETRATVERILKEFDWSLWKWRVNVDGKK